MVKNFLHVALFFQLLITFSCRQPSGSFLSHPNILWITSEDMNPFLGAYGDSLARTPNLDKLAGEGVLYRNAFATAPVCSPSRSCIITGVYATSLGTQHLRSEITIPEQIRGFPKYLREAGYYCTNNVKEDYNFTDTTIWDESSATAHWRNRAEGQPFFSVFNFETTHQSQIFGSDSAFYEKYGRLLEESERCDPATVPVPPYHFDSPTVRKLWARYYDLVTLMDRQAGEILQQLEDDGLADNTIVFYYSDHGTGMPRSKRALYDSGLKVPLIIKAPPAWQEELGLPAGTESEELVSFVDFAPTILNLAGIDIPDYMQGTSFLGPGKQTQEYVYGHADRVDEAYEIARTVRTKQYRYIRNYLPQLPLIQDNFFTDQSEIMQELRRLKAQGNFTPAQAAMWQPTRPPEELYDVREDPFEVNNLADQAEYREVLLELREAQKQWALRTYDSGLLHESDMHALAENSTIYEAIRQPEKFPIERILGITDQMLEPDWEAASALPLLDDDNRAVRYWAAMLLHIRGWNDPAISAALTDGLQDPAGSVRLTAAQALCSRGDCDEALPVVWQELHSSDKMVRLLAARTYEELGDQAAPIREKVEEMTVEQCPQEDWSYYYKLYTCWALQEAEKKVIRLSSS
jgi:N-sulfoglucosamine sulfohydrolase